MSSQSKDWLVTISAWTFAGLVGIIAFVALLTTGYLLDGWVLSKLWAWLVIPITHTTLTLTVVSAIALNLVVGFLTHQGIPSYKNLDVDYVKTFRTLYVAPFVTLLIGFILHRFFIH